MLLIRLKNIAQLLIEFISDLAYFFEQLIAYLFFCYTYLKINIKIMAPANLISQINRGFSSIHFSLTVFPSKTLVLILLLTDI